tara:strand:+ start:19905 stop:20282 length:378 start_codon:yes stop_codon:yes gene_type:complete
LFIQPGKPYQNCYIERFNGIYRSEILNKYIFDSIKELQTITDDWLIFYNNKRPHSSLGGLPPKRFIVSLKVDTVTGAGHHKWKNLMEEGKFDSLADIARKEKLVLLMLAKFLTSIFYHQKLSKRF